MNENLSVFQLMGETSASIYPLARDIMRPLFEKYFSEQGLYQPLFLAYNLRPEPISVDLFQLRNPYANPDSIQEILEEAVEAGYLEEVGVGQYRPSRKGASAIELVHEAFYNHINQLDHFPADQLKELCSLLAKLVGSIKETDLGGRKICFEASFGGHIRADHGTLARVDQHLDDLNAFRDDAHITAWRPVGVDGHTWEVLTLVWNGEANTPEKLVERLPYRQYTKKEYQGTLEDLVQKGWVKAGSEDYLVTGEGKKIRDQAEVDTDALYFGPWSVLTEEEINRLGELLAELKDLNQEILKKNNEEE